MRRAVEARITEAEPGAVVRRGSSCVPSASAVTSGIQGTAGGSDQLDAGVGGDDEMVHAEENQAWILRRSASSAWR
jgi:hypothetical protein